MRLPSVLRARQHISPLRCAARRAAQWEHREAHYTSCPAAPGPHRGATSWPTAFRRLLPSPAFRHQGAALLQNRAGCEGDAFCCQWMLWKNRLGSKEGTQQLTREVRGYRNPHAFLELFLCCGSASPLLRNESA